MSRAPNTESTSLSTADLINAAWITSPSSATDVQRAQHEAAIALLREYQATGRPFALFLRAFDIHQMYGEGPDGYPEFSLDAHLHNWLRVRGAGLVRIQDASDGASIAMEGIRGKEVPALLLDNALWLSAVKTLIGASQLIVSECQFLKPGVLAELQACVELGKVDRTVLILPSPPFPVVSNETEVQAFPRAMHQHELDPKYPARSPIFEDLIDRMAQIANLDPKERVRLTRSGELDKVIPVTFRGVAPGLFRIAQDYAREKNVGATYVLGSRAAKAALAGSGLQEHLDYLLRFADLCDEAGDTKLALTILDEVAKAMETRGSDLSSRSCKHVLAGVRRRRSKWLAALFESLMTPEHGEELWNLANSQAGYAIQRHDIKIQAQCFSWMAVAAVLGGKYELAKECAGDAIRFAEGADLHRFDGAQLKKVSRVPRDRFRLAFSYFYLGHAYRGLGQIGEAAEKYAKAIQFLPRRPIRPLHALAMLSLGQASEELGHSEDTLQLYQSAEIIAKGTGRPDLAKAAAEGIKRLSSRNTP